MKARITMDHKDVGFTIYRGAFSCSWCDKAKDLLEDSGHEYTVEKLGMSDLIIRQAKEKHHTVPLIYHGVVFIGGFSDLQTYITQKG